LDGEGKANIVRGLGLKVLRVCECESMRVLIYDVFEKFVDF
tara:strand:+ start:426 stop:548 length:123 start_codon:yes stop_codon:yes gene_type:complete